MHLPACATTGHTLRDWFTDMVINRPLLPHHHIVHFDTVVRICFIVIVLHTNLEVEHNHKYTALEMYLITLRNCIHRDISVDGRIILKQMLKNGLQRRRLDASSSGQG